MHTKFPFQIRCRSAGRVRSFFRSKILLAGWRPRALPPAPCEDTAGTALERLVGADLHGRVSHALHHTDTLAGRIGGCARDAYTVLYACAAFAVLFAAWGVVASEPGPVRNVLAVSELGILVLLFITFQSAHRVNWHGHWLGLRFHAEFLRCLPVLAALRHDPEPAPAQRHAGHGPATGQEPPHLAALADAHHGAADPQVASHEAAQQRVRSQLLGELKALYHPAPRDYAGQCLAWSRMLAQQQLRYHCLRAQQEQAIVRRVHTLSVAGFALTIGAVASHFWLHAPVLTVISTGVPAFAASLHGFVAQEESERLAVNYRSMARRLDDWLGASLGPGAGLEELQGHLGRLVELMMSEVRDWHRLFGDKGMYHLG